jgi:hypothetical protein
LIGQVADFLDEHFGVICFIAGAIIVIPLFGIIAILAWRFFIELVKSCI